VEGQIKLVVIVERWMKGGEVVANLWYLKWKGNKFVKPKEVLMGV
jgi:hypothetical protein